MRTIRLVSSHALADLSLIDESTGQRIHDVLRVEPSPIELRESRWFARIFTHERALDGSFRYDTDGAPITLAELVELRVGSVWSV